MKTISTQLIGAVLSLRVEFESAAPEPRLERDTVACENAAATIRIEARVNEGTIELLIEPSDPEDWSMPD